MSKKTIKLFIFVLFICNFFYPQASFARDNVYEWYIKNFDTEIISEKDSSLLITEKITADCGNAPNKHGIFRTLPTRFKTTEKSIKMPVSLLSITDFNNVSLQYSVSNDPINHTVTWKIGDPQKTVTGENYYKIVYRVQKAILFDNPNFDEFYWNLNGNFWDLEIDNFSAKIIFPPEVTPQKSFVEYYTGFVGERNKDLVSIEWIGDNVLFFVSKKQTIQKGQGITVSATFPKGIFLQPKLGFFEKYGMYLWFLWPILPLLSFLLCFRIWEKYGKDPKIDRATTPEFEIPGNISPMDMGMIMTMGKFKNEFVSASILSFAVKNLISIEEIEKSWVHWPKRKEFKLVKKNDSADLTHPEKLLFEKLFNAGSDNEVLLSSLKDSFYTDVSEVKKAEVDDLSKRKLITKVGLSLQKVFLTIGIILIFVSFFPSFPIFSGLAPSYTLAILGFASFLSSAFIIFFFSFIMPQRTVKGAELMWKIKGFKLYMETAEKYRQRFYEKENIFEKFLPYAMVFGITGIWIKKMQEIYGEKYFSAYAPIWFSGSNIGSFDADSFQSNLSSLSSSIGSNISSPSGSSGGGFSGGGGGGGGGGGW